MLPLIHLRRFVWIFYGVGLIGLAVPFTRPVFQFLIPVYFIVALAVLFYVDKTGWGKLLPISLFIFVAGWALEVAGVNTGLIFGDYAYGKYMGPKVMHTPLAIGLSWLMMIYLTVALAQKITMHPLYRTVLAAVFMVVYDFILEPVAMALGMWDWAGDKVPMQNYLTWFGASLFLAALFPIFKIRIRSRLAGAVFAAQVLMFLLLNLVLLIQSWLHP